MENVTNLTDIQIKTLIERHKLRDFLFASLGLLLLVATLSILLCLIANLAHDGFSRISRDFFLSFPSRFSEQAGILSAWIGSTIVMGVTAFMGIPVGVAAALYLEEYAKKNWFTVLIEINISNLAGVPSIVFGLMALGIFVHRLNFGASILTAGLTLSLLILPIIITATRESIRAIPTHIREAAMAVGATKWQTIQHHVIPYSAGGIYTGIVIALSRAVGETAPLITIGALTFIAFLPASPVQVDPPFVNFHWLMDAFTVMPIQMFNWISRPQASFHTNAAAAGLILMAMTLTMNSIAIFLRMRFRKRIKW